MDAKSQAELEILMAADRWARDILRQDRLLDPVEQKLFETIMHYQRLTRSIVEIPPPDIPRPPYIPSQELKSYIEPDTMRYSDIPTVPSPAQGMPAVRRDIEPIELENLEWTGKQKPE
jgi:hypothetical protein